MSWSTNAALADDDEKEDRLTVARLFQHCGIVARSNYTKEWTGQDYRMLCGKYKGDLLSQIDSPKYLQWCLNFFEDELEHDLKRALIDQFNAQVK